ncbi:short chain dehydrogenase [Colletotrichum karsti]|uniref:Short chain dehydrogenase n=1 Tax=Colletotrichum karsti TaxID=1095194 RepID=A0A9P6HY25_9PEZI|nr:short chain dehydrogenase [Colletotrichum karsti]KAF9870426.1 short chain dehydrogenase [Colletotrichum karsti]
MVSTDKKIVFITGGNQGVGYETAKNLLLSSADYHVILGSRDAGRGETAAKELRSAEGAKGSASSVQIDVTDDKSIQAAADRIESDYGRLDVLVNNAGIISMASPPSTAAFRKVLDTNVIGALGVTEALLPLLKKAAHTPARLVFVSSSMGSITHAADPSSPYYNPHGTEYRVSKAAVNMLLTMYAARLKPEGFLVLGADPGLCATNFTGDPTSLRNRGAAEPSDGGERVATVIKGEKDENAGRVVGVYGVCPW